jgi:tRNA(Ile)-lysidine synthase
MPLDLEERFRASAAHDGLVSEGEHVLVGVSGGVDSVVLLHLLCRLPAKCRAIHIDYGLRPESADDATFVRDLSRGLDVPLDTVKLAEGWLDEWDGHSVQEAARVVRYEQYELIARRHDIRTVAVAHHLDDQVETVLLRMIRGTGILGVSGMRKRRPLSSDGSVEVVRPLLDTAREEIVDWATRNRLSFREDRSNLDARFDRSRMRAKVVSAIRESFGASALRNIARSADQVGLIVDEIVGPRLEKDLLAVSEIDGPERIRLDVAALRRHPDGWRRLLLLEAAKRWAPGAPDRASTAEQLDSLLGAQSGKKVLLGTTQVWKSHGDLVFLCDPEPSGGGEEIPVEIGQTVDFETLTLMIEMPQPASQAAAVYRNPTGPKNHEYVDADKLCAPITVGHWRDGERFQPLGMTGSRTVSDFLTDLKVPAHEKRRVPVVRSGGEIVWVVGYRLAEPFRLTPTTGRVVLLSAQSSEPSEIASDRDAYSGSSI